MPSERKQLTADLIVIRKAFREGRLEPSRWKQLGGLMFLPLNSDGQLRLSDLPETYAEMLRVEAHRMRAQEREACPPTETNVHDAMRELFSLYQELVTSAIGLRELRSTPDGAINELLYSKLSSASRQRAVLRVAEKLTRFFDQKNASIVHQASRLGGIKLAAERQCPGLPYDGAISAPMALYADTQLFVDPVVEQFRRMSGREVLAIAVADACRKSLMRPLVDAALEIPPVIVFQRDNKRPPIRAPEDDLQDGGKWSRVWRQALMERANLANLSEDSPDYLLNHIKALSFVKVEELHDLIGSCEQMGGDPLISDEMTHRLYRALCCFASDALERKCKLSPTSRATCVALQEEEHSWLRNVPMKSIPFLLKTQENQFFREKLDGLTKEFRAASLDDIDEVSKAVGHALSLLLQQHDSELDKISRKYAPKNQSLLYRGGGGAAGAGIVASIYPLLSYPYNALADMIIGSGLTSLGVLGTSAAAYLGNYIEEMTEKRQQRRSLLGVLAMAKRSS